MDSFFVNAWEEFERLRRLLPERPDWQLHNWGVWRRKEHLTDGYGERSSGLATGGLSGDDAFSHLCEPVDEWAANVSESIIEGLPLLQRIAICHVYEGETSSFRTVKLLEETLIAAALIYWKEAKARGLS